MPKLPPSVNGVADLTAAQIKTIYGKLIVIRDAFVETDEQPVCDTFYLVATYNKANKGNEVNGDTAEYVLSVGDPNVTPAG
jgi:hypothetical protein